MPEITHRQAEALRVLDWLFREDEPDARRSGRTFILALAYLRYACRRPGTDWINVEDHTHVLNRDTREADRVLLSYIANIAEECGAIVEIAQGRFRMTGLDDDAYHFLMEEFVETDFYVGMTPEQQARYRQMHGRPVTPQRPPPDPEAPRRSLWERLEEDSV